MKKPEPLTDSGFKILSQCNLCDQKRSTELPSLSKIFFSEALFIGVVCSLLAVIGTFVSEFFIDRYFVDEVGISVLQFSLATVGLIFAIALAITFIATIIPVVHSSRKPPVESIRAL